MKSLSTIALVLLLVAAFSLPVNASAAEESGIRPGSFFYGFVTTFEKINLFFTFNPEKKVEKALRYAEKRLVEVEAVADEGNSDAVKTAAAGYEKNIALATEASKKVNNEARAENLLVLITDNTSRHQEVLTEVWAKVPDEAKEAITKAIEASRKGHVEAMQKIAELKGEVERLKLEVAELKAKDEERERAVGELSKQKTDSPATQQKISTPQAPVTSTPKTEPAKTSIVTLPNGAVVEMDTNGNILRYIKEAPINTTTQTPTTPVAPSPTALQTQTETLEITSVEISSIDALVRIKWQTNKPTESKVFISDGGLSSKIFNSESGISTTHLVSIAGLKANTVYSYEIEAIFNNNSFAKKTGEFDTLLLFPLPVFISGPEAVIISQGGKYSINNVKWKTDKPTTVIWLEGVADRSWERLCAPSDNDYLKGRMSSGSLESRTIYVCTLKVQDTIGNIAEKQFSFTTGYGGFSVDFWNGNSGLGGGGPQDILTVLRFINTDKLPVVVKKLSFEFELIGRVSTTSESKFIIKDRSTGQLLFEVPLSNSITVQNSIASPEIDIIITQVKDVATGDFVALRLTSVEIDRTDINLYYPQRYPNTYGIEPIYLAQSVWVR